MCLRDGALLAIGGYNLVLAWCQGLVGTLIHVSYLDYFLAILWLFLLRKCIVHDLLQTLPIDLVLSLIDAHLLILILTVRNQPLRIIQISLTIQIGLHLGMDGLIYVAIVP